MAVIYWFTTSDYKIDSIEAGGLLADKGIRWELLAQVRLMLPDWLSKAVSRLSYV